MPWVRARLPPELELSWRARWVGRYLFTDRAVFYGFDDYHPRLGWTLRPGLRGLPPVPGQHGQLELARRARHGRARAGAAPGPPAHRGPGRLVHLRRRRGRRRGLSATPAGAAGRRRGGREPRRSRLWPRPDADPPARGGAALPARPGAARLLGRRRLAQPAGVPRLREAALRAGGRRARRSRGSPVPRALRAPCCARRCTSHALELLAIPWSRRRAAPAAAREQDALMAALFDADARRVATRGRALRHRGPAAGGRTSPAGRRDARRADARWPSRGRGACPSAARAPRYARCRPRAACTTTPLSTRRWRRRWRAA